MSETERRLVGTWGVGSDPNRNHIELTRGRRIVAVSGATKTLGAWHASQGKLYLSYDQPFPQTRSAVPVYLTQVVWRDQRFTLGPVDLEFEGATRLHLRDRTASDGELFEEVMERIP